MHACPHYMCSVQEPPWNYNKRHQLGPLWIHAPLELAVFRSSCWNIFCNRFDGLVRSTRVVGPIVALIHSYSW